MEIDYDAAIDFKALKLRVQSPGSGCSKSAVQSYVKNCYFGAAPR